MPSRRGARVVWGASRWAGKAGGGVEKGPRGKREEISATKDQLRQAKEGAIQEYCDSEALLAECGSLFVDGFDDCFHQVKASYPDLDLSHVSIDTQAQTPAQPVYSTSTNELFNDDTVIDPQGEEETAPVALTSPVGGDTCPVEGDQKSKDGENWTLLDLDFFFFFNLL